MAALANDVEELKSLLSLGAVLNCKNGSGETPLHYACGKGNVEAVRYLLAVDGIQVNAVNRGLYTPLHSAVTSGSLAVVQMILRAGGNVTMQDEEGDTPLHMACQSGNVQVVKAILEYVDYNEIFSCKNRKSLTPSKCAASEYIRVLLDNRFFAVQESKQELKKEYLSHEGDGEDDGPPQEPDPSACCGSGCKQCVWDVYYQRVDEYNNKNKKKISMTS